MGLLRARRTPLWGTAPLVLGAVLLSACECPDAATVLPVEQHRYDVLLARYGSEALPYDECEALCLSPSALGTGCGGQAPGGSAGAAGAAVGGAGGTGGQGGIALAGAGGAAAATGGSAECTSTAPGFGTLDECKLVTIRWTVPAILCSGTLACM